MDYSVLDSDFMFIWIYLQNLGSETAERLVLINILRDSLDIQGIVNQTFFDCITFPLLIVNDNF